MDTNGVGKGEEERDGGKGREGGRQVNQHPSSSLMFHVLSPPVPRLFYVHTKPTLKSTSLYWQVSIGKGPVCCKVALQVVSPDLESVIRIF